MNIFFQVTPDLEVVVEDLPKVKAGVIQDINHRLIGRGHKQLTVQEFDDLYDLSLRDLIEFEISTR